MKLGHIQIYYCILTRLNDLVQNYKMAQNMHQLPSSNVNNGVKCIYIICTLEIPFQLEKSLQIHNAKNRLRTPNKAFFHQNPKLLGWMEILGR